MDLLELNTNVDKIIKYLPKTFTPEKVPVYITLSEPSLGGRAFTSISCITMGGDWEHGQFRIEPEDKLVRESTVKAIYEIEPDEYVCSKCGCFLQDNFKYCPKCGGKIGKVK